MNRFNGELQDLERAADIGERWGYGNVISYLRVKWADRLCKSIKDPYAAGLGAWMSEEEAKLYAKAKKSPNKKGER